MKLKSTNTDADKRFQKASPLAASLLCIAILGVMAFQEANATSGWGVSAQPLAVGGLTESIRVKLKADTGFESGVEVADIVAVRYTVAPGGYFGWHNHGGPVWVVIEHGTLTLYDPHEPGCARTYGPGTAFLDSGDHVHNARNEGAVPVVVHGTFLLPDGAPLRIDAPAPDPSVCTLPPL